MSPVGQLEVRGACSGKKDRERSAEEYEAGTAAMVVTQRGISG